MVLPVSRAALGLQVYISVGALAKQRLLPRRIEGVVDAMRPLLREGAYGTALEHAVVQIGLILSGPAGAERARKQQEAAAPDDPWWWSWAPVGLFASVFGFAGARQWRQRRRRSAATRELRRLQRDLQVRLFDAARDSQRHVYARGLLVSYFVARECVA